MTAADGPTPVSAEPVAAVQVVPLELEHLAAAARLHRRLLPSFFADLGLPYLRSYLNSYRTSPHAVALVALLEGQVVGLLVGSVSPAEHASWALRTHGGRLALWGLLGLATRPRPLVVFVRTRVSRYVRALLRRLRPLPPRATGSAVTTAPAVLAHVAVATAAQGHGAGQALVQRLRSARIPTDGGARRRRWPCLGPVPS